MFTEKLYINSENYTHSISRAAELLKKGGVVAIPTETVYGLAASAYDDNAIKKVFEAKGRPQDNPLIVHISDMCMIDDIAIDVDERARECARRFWPGPFTMVLKKSGKIAQSVSAGLDTVAVRMPSDRVARDIISACGVPLAAPSANISGAPSPTRALDVATDMDGRIDAIVMGGDCQVGVESTVISLCGDTPRLLRPGAVTVEQIKEVLGDIEIDKAVLAQPEEGKQVSSPGMKYKHYAPDTDTFLVDCKGNSFADFVNSKQNAVALCFEEEAESISVKKIVYGYENDESTLAKNLFTALRLADTFGGEKIYVHAPSKQGVGLAVYNRLIRAAAFRVIEL